MLHFPWETKIFQNLTKLSNLSITKSLVYTNLWSLGKQLWKKELTFPREMKHFLKLMTKSNLWRSKNSNSKVERVREIQNNEFQEKVAFPLRKQTFRDFIKISEFCRWLIFWSSTHKFVWDFWSQDFEVLVKEFCGWFFRRFLLIILVEGFFRFCWRFCTNFCWLIYGRIFVRLTLKNYN